VKPAPLALAALAALALTGCETTAEKSARLEKAALARAKTTQSGSAPATFAPSSKLHVTETALVHGSEGWAAVVTVRNDSGGAELGAPISIAVHGAGGASLYTNAEGGLSRSLTTLPLIPAHGEVTWVDDQVQVSGTPTGLTAKLGEGTAAKQPPYPLRVSSQTPVSEPGGGEAIAGKVTNRAGVEQQELVVFAVARRAGRVVGAGRAVLPTLSVGATSPFQIFVTGSARGARIEVSAPSAASA
jgi:hypothetical protein